MNADDYNDLNELISAAVADLSVKLAPPDPVLSKREWFAGLAMQSFISMIEGSAATVDELREVAAVTALTSTLFADALLAELAKEPAP